MNIEPDIFDYLQTTSLEPHDDYTSEITYKDQKIIWNRLQEQDKEIEKLENSKSYIDAAIRFYESKSERGKILEKDKEVN